MKNQLHVIAFIGAVAISANSIGIAYAQPEVVPGAGFNDPVSDSGQADDLITLNLQDVDIRILINTVAEVSKKNFVVDQRVKGKVTVISGEQLNSEQLYEVFLSILQVHNFAAVESGSLIKIVPSNIVKQLPTPTRYSPVTEASDAQVTQVLKLTHSSVQELIPIIRPLIPPTSHFAAHVPTNTLVVTDNAANIKRVLEIIEKIDVPDQRSSVRVVYLQKANATELAGILNQMVPSLGSSDPKAGGAPAAQRLNIQAQPSINALIINSSDTDYAMLEAIIEQLDIDRPVEGDVHVLYLKHAKATELVTILNEVTRSATGAGQEGRPASTLNVQADEATNSLIINADVAEFRTIKAVVAQLDVRRSQVFIETIIAEVTLNQAAELGINLNSDPTLVDRDNPNQVVGNINAGTNFATAGGSGLTYNLIDFGRYRFDLLLRAIRSDSNSNILSTPTILTLDNEPAEITVGEEVPFITGQFTNNSTAGTTTGTDANGNTTTTGTTNPFQTIERRDVGIKLNITPQINDGDTIQLEVMQEISDVTNAATAAGAADVITSRRSIETVVQVDDGQVIVLGGLIQDDVEDSIDKVPLLGDIPLVGALFRRKTKNAVKRNLMVFLKPTIIRSPQELTNFSKRRYEQIRASEKVGQQKTRNLIPGALPPVLKEYDEVVGEGQVSREPPKKRGTWLGRQLKGSRKDQEVLEQDTLKQNTLKKNNFEEPIELEEAGNPQESVIQPVDIIEPPKP